MKNAQPELPQISKEIKMLAMVCCSALCIASAAQRADVLWPQALVTSEHARLAKAPAGIKRGHPFPAFVAKEERVVRGQAAPQAGKSGPSVATRGGNTSGPLGGAFSAEELKYLKREDETQRSDRRLANNLIARGKFDNAASQLELDVARFPGDWDFGEQLADVYLYLDRHDDAYRTLIYMLKVEAEREGLDGSPESLRRSGGGSHLLRDVPFLDRLAIASAEDGEVYPGEARFLIDQINTSFGGFIHDPSQYLPSGSTPRESAFLGDLALVYTISNGGEWWLTSACAERALSMDAANPVAFYAALDQGVMQNWPPSASFAQHLEGIATEGRVSQVFARIADEDTRSNFRWLIGVRLRDYIREADKR